MRMELWTSAYVASLFFVCLHLEIYLQEAWPVIEKKLGDCGIKCELNLVC